MKTNLNSKLGLIFIWQYIKKKKKNHCDNILHDDHSFFFVRWPLDYKENWKVLQYAFNM